MSCSSTCSPAWGLAGDAGALGSFAHPSAPPTRCPASAGGPSARAESVLQGGCKLCHQLRCEIQYLWKRRDDYQKAFVQTVGFSVTGNLCLLLEQAGRSSSVVASVRMCENVICKMQLEIARNERGSAQKRLSGDPAQC